MLNAMLSMTRSASSSARAYPLQMMVGCRLRSRKGSAACAGGRKAEATQSPMRANSC